MSNQISRLWERLDTSIWFVPVIISVVAVILAITLLGLDHAIARLQWQWLEQFHIGADGMRQVLTVTTGATMTITGVVFSVTMVTLALASNQLGPKILRNYLRDTGNKAVLGLFVGAFLYGLIVLASIDTRQDYFVPVLSVFISLVWTIVAIAGLIYFIHNTAIMIQADHVIAVIGKDLNEAIDRTLVENVASSPVQPCKPEWTIIKKGLLAQSIYTTKSGYVQSIDYDGLTRITAEHGCFLKIEKRAGQFVVQGVRIATCFSTKRVADDLKNKVLANVILASQRTPLQDIGFEIEQLLQIALRALSPGINDPSTAISCIDWLSAALGRMAGFAFPSYCFRDTDDTLRVVACGVNFAEIANAIFDPLRQCTRGNELVTLHLLDTLNNVIAVAKFTEYRAVLFRQSKLIHESAMESITCSADRKIVTERFRRSQQAL